MVLTPVDHPVKAENKIRLRLGTVNVGTMRGRHGEKNRDVRVSWVKVSVGKILTAKDNLKEKWKDCFEKLLNEELEWDKDEMLERRRIDIYCLQETRWKSNGVCHVNPDKEKYKLFCNGHKTDKNGVGIFVREPLAQELLYIKSINSRLM
ncbi:hypothetical protein HELRODRAFT_179118 [Helobdella robusta]|uniref:Endonuclease/exonuclease/phosphatase domain-containing protein n=1 Tax=Helobdella robusta TaxID=6412 RepID=T1FE68_HELRO|nr:hypothetical protein HELRODRAFT_179118 [Helobdella robusta]ESN95648.1 hypothetical protein HELRODRAFT_179118 [Helobdella robusta]